MNDGRALIVQGDALHLPLPDGSVDLVVTSPPYWALRSYSAGPGEIGSEPTPQAFLEALWAATGEMTRVLKPTGSIFVDLGDKYAAHPTGHKPDEALHTRGGRTAMYQAGMGQYQAGMGRQKSLLLLPERYRVGAVDRLGLIARAVIVWDKPNGFPESVTDRVRRSHEDWVHLVKQPRYYSATDEIREPQLHPNHGQIGKTQNRNRPGWMDLDDDQGRAVGMNSAVSPHYINPLGKLPGSVWSVPSEPLRLPDHLGVQHYAAFPSEWPRRLILGFSPPGICLDCGTGRVPVVERQEYEPNTEPIRGDGVHHRSKKPGQANSHGAGSATILGYACACTPHTNHPGSGGTAYQDKLTAGRLAGSKAAGDDARRPALGSLEQYEKVGPWREYHLDRWTPPPTRPAIILDPFTGTGTTPMVARALGRIGIGVDLSHAYCRAARWRVAHDGAKAISRTNLERQGTLL